MKAVIFSDVHGNLPALELLLKSEPADIYLSLGDVVNYGPWSNECVQLLESLSNAILLKGNHEDAFISGQYSGNGLAKRFFDFCYPSFNRVIQIKRWEDSFNIGEFTFCHTIDNRIVYPDSQIPFTGNYVIGHSHHQSYHRNEGKKLYVIGSVGQNRQYINRIDYMVWDKKMELRHMIYDEKVVINEMKARNYPIGFIEYYSKKQKV